MSERNMSPQINWGEVIDLNIELSRQGKKIRPFTRSTQWKMENNLFTLVTNRGPRFYHGSALLEHELLDCKEVMDKNTGASSEVGITNLLRIVRFVPRLPIHLVVDFQLERDEEGKRMPVKIVRRRMSETWKDVADYERLQRQEPTKETLIYIRDTLRQGRKQ